MWKQRNMKIGGDWHHMLGVFFCFPTGRWEVSGKLAKKVWAYIENLHVYLLFQICNGKKIVNIYWNHYFLKGRKKSFRTKTCVEWKKISTSFQPPLDRNLGLSAMVWGAAMWGKKTKVEGEVVHWNWPQCSAVSRKLQRKSKEPVQINGWRKTKGSPWKKVELLFKPEKFQLSHFPAHKEKNEPVSCHSDYRHHMYEENKFSSS